MSAKIPDLDLNARDSHGNTPLILAVKTRNVRIVKFLLSIDGIDLDATVEDNEACKCSENDSRKMGGKRNRYKTRDERVGPGRTALELSLKCAAVHQVSLTPHSYHLALSSPAVSHI